MSNYNTRYDFRIRWLYAVLSKLGFVNLNGYDYIVVITHSNNLHKSVVGGKRNKGYKIQKLIS